jgi:hypothetical protein
MEIESSAQSADQQKYKILLVTLHKKSARKSAVCSPTAQEPYLHSLLWNKCQTCNFYLTFEKSEK